MPQTENRLTGWVYILSLENGDWYFGACRGDLSACLAAHDRDGPGILLWAQAVTSVAAAEKMRDAIAEWPDERQESLVRGEIDPPTG